MDRKQKMYLIAGILGLLLILLVIFWPKAKTTTTNNQPVATTPTTQQPADQTPPPAFVPDKTASAPVVNPVSSLLRRAMTFAERYGSYSTDAPNQNILAIAGDMTEEMSAVAALQAGADLSKAKKGEFYGVTSRAVTGDRNAFDEAAGTASFTVKLQRDENSGGKTKIYYQDLKLGYVRQNNRWLIDSANWSSEKFNP